MWPERFADQATRSQAITDASIHLGEMKAESTVRRKHLSGVQVWEPIAKPSPTADAVTAGAAS
jgi:hypothetical protein